jgi:hypothetical protein
MSGERSLDPDAEWVPSGFGRDGQRLVFFGSERAIMSFSGVRDVVFASAGQSADMAAPEPPTASQGVVARFQVVP